MSNLQQIPKTFHYRLVVKEAKDGQWYFNMVAPNNKVVMTSEMYVTKRNAKKAAETIAEMVGGDELHTPFKVEVKNADVQ